MFVCLGKYRMKGWWVGLGAVGRGGGSLEHGALIVFTKPFQIQFKPQCSLRSEEAQSFSGERAEGDKIPPPEYVIRYFPPF